MAVKTKAELRTYWNTKINTNGIQAITGAIQNVGGIDIIDSMGMATDTGGGATFDLPIGTPPKVLGALLTYDTRDATWKTANSSEEETTAQGIVTSVTATTATLTITGEFDWKHGLSVNTWYYTSPVGGYTSTKPSADNYVQPVLYTLTNATAYACVTVPHIANLTDAFSTFLALGDTPSLYTGNKNNYVVVNEAGDALKFVEPPKTYIVDTVADRDALTGVASLDRSVVTADAAPTNNGHYLANVSPLTGVVTWILVPTTGVTRLTELIDTPASYTTAKGRTLRVNEAENAIEFIQVGANLGEAVLTTIPTGAPAHDDHYEATVTGDYPGFRLTGVAAGSLIRWNGTTWLEEKDISIKEPIADGNWLRKVTNTATTPVHEWTEEINGGSY